jgi:hypothetical protein
MADSTATPLPAPDSNEGASNTPSLNVLPDTESKRRSPSTLNLEIEAKLQDAADVCTAAQKPERVGPLASKEIDQAFVTELSNEIIAAGEKARKAAACTSDRKDGVQTGGAAEEKLVASLREIQKAARQKHLPDHPAKLEKYHIGEEIAQSKTTLESCARDIIGQANEERPPGINTEVILRVEGEKTECETAKAMPGQKQAEGEQLRQEVEQMLKSSIIPRRKKIQYAADGLWPHGKPENVQTRKDFNLPANRPYSY